MCDYEIMSQLINSMEIMDYGMLHATHTIKLGAEGSHTRYNPMYKYIICMDFVPHFLHKKLLCHYIFYFFYNPACIFLQNTTKFLCD